jgi:predicted  nucleic acid-binding Zn-ribbon protein
VTLPSVVEKPSEQNSDSAKLWHAYHIPCNPDRGPGSVALCGHVQKVDAEANGFMALPSGYQHCVVCDDLMPYCDRCGSR